MRLAAAALAICLAGAAAAQEIGAPVPGRWISIEQGAAVGYWLTGPEIAGAVVLPRFVIAPDGGATLTALATRDGQDRAERLELSAEWATFAPGAEAQSAGFVRVLPARGGVQPTAVGSRVTLVVEAVEPSPVLDGVVMLTGRYAARVCIAPDRDAAPDPTRCLDVAGRFETEALTAAE